MELWQWHCRIPFHFSQFQKFFLPPYFGNIIATIAKNLYTLFQQYHCYKLFFFPPIFGNGIATIAKNFFFPSFGFPCAHSHFEHPPGQQVWAEGIAVISLLKQKISLSYFLSFSFQLLLNFGNGIAAIHSLFSCY